MQSLIQDLLDLSKIEQQGFQLELRKCNVNEFLKEIHHLLDRKAKEKILILYWMFQTSLFLLKAILIG